MDEHVFFNNIQDAIKIFRRRKMDETTIENSVHLSCSSVCVGGHTAVWAGDPNHELPPGYPCSCGQTKLYYTTCATCGHKKMEFR